MIAREPARARSQAERQVLPPQRGGAVAIAEREVSGWAGVGAELDGGGLEP